MVTCAQTPEIEVRLHIEHYETIKDALDVGEKGWREFTSMWGDGKFLCRVEDIVQVFLCTSNYCEERNADDEKEKLEA